MDRGQRTTGTALRAVLTVLCPLFVLSAVGCRNNCELVEAELRTRERDLRELRDELCRTEAYNEALERELRALRQGGVSHVYPEEASQKYALQSVVLGRQTGGVNNDDCPGDEALQVVLEPRDPDGHAIKAPGALQVTILEVSREGQKVPLCSWQVAPDQLRRSWRGGLWSTGYFVVLPWKKWPTTEKLRVVAQLTLSDGRTFEADKDITVRLIPEAHRQPLPLEAAEPATPLPPPRKLEGPSLPDAEPISTWQKPASLQPVRAVEIMRPVPLR